MAAGRSPDVGESRDQYLRVRLAPFETKGLDHARNGQSRSDYVRALIHADLRDRGLLDLGLLE